MQASEDLLSVGISGDGLDLGTQGGGSFGDGLVLHELAKPTYGIMGRARFGRRESAELVEGVVEKGGKSVSGPQVHTTPQFGDGGGTMAITGFASSVFPEDELPDSENAGD